MELTDSLLIHFNNPRYLISADLGQITDYSAISVIERKLTPASAPQEHRNADGSKETRMDVETSYEVVRLDRPPLRTPYTKISSGVVKLIHEYYRRHLQAVAVPEGVALTHPNDDRIIRVGLAVDATGVGVAVSDIIKQQIIDSPLIQPGKPKVAYYPISIHGGTKASRNGQFYSIPKVDLIHSGVVAFQNERLKIRELRHRDVLTKELQNFRMKINLNTAHTSFEAWRERDHDDLVLSVCMGVLSWEKLTRQIRYVSGPPTHFAA
jgi:hypothetical protein